jgi:hypothetical protein
VRALIRNGINIDDRTAVESALSDTASYTHDPAVFARYVDEVIKTARRYMAAGQPIRPTTTMGAGPRARSSSPRGRR